MMDKQRLWLERCGLLVVILLPLTFNPFAEHDFFEPAKVFLFRSLVLLMGLIAILPSLFHRLPIFPQRHSDAKKKTVQFKNPIALPVIVYGAISLLATAVSINPIVSLWGRGNRHGTVTILTVLLFFLLLTITFQKWNQIERLITAVIFGSIPVIFYGYIQYFGFDSLNWVGDSVSPVHSTMGRSLYLGAYLAMVIPFTLARLVDRWGSLGKQRPLVYGTLLLFQMVCLMLTLARGAWIGFIGSMLLFFILMAYRRPNWIIGFFLLLLIGSALFAFITVSGSSLFLATIPVPTAEVLPKIRLGSNKTRIVTWQNTLPLIPKKWFFGYGPETYPIMMEKAENAGLLSEPNWILMNDPHNLILNKLTAVGIAGLLSFLWIVARFYHSNLAFLHHVADSDKKATISAIISSATAYLILAQFNPDVITLTVMLWVNFALGSRVTNIATNRLCNPFCTQV